jgi:hypothetical protein
VLSRSDVCVVCGRALAVGDEAVWDRSRATMTCLECHPAPPPPLSEGSAGASALREYERRRGSRRDHARQTLGSVGAALAWMTNEPQSTKAWQQGGVAEVRAGERLAKHLREHGVALLHDRRVPGHGRANIDHLAIGPAGITVIDTKALNGKVRTQRVGGLFKPRRTILEINGRDRTGLVDAVEIQVGYVRTALHGVRFADPVEIRGALCFPDPDGLPLVSGLKVREVVIDGPKRIAKFARRPGSLDTEAIRQLWEHLVQALPPA